MHVYLLAITLAAATGSARPTPPVKPAAAQRIDIDDDELVEGGTASAEGEVMLARKQARFGTLIKLRTDFHPELLKSGE